MFQTLVLGAALFAVNNPDNSVTFKHPVLVRGTDKYKISQESTHGACAMFQAGLPLRGSVQIVKDKQASDTAVLNEEGRLLGFESSKYSISAITCFDPNSFAPITSAKFITRNVDGSYKILKPIMEVGGETLPLTGDPTYVCAAFGFPHFLTRTAVQMSGRFRAATVDAIGRFLIISEEAPGLDSLSCFHEGEHRDTGSSDD